MKGAEDSSRRSVSYTRINGRAVDSSAPPLYPLPLMGYMGYMGTPGFSYESVAG